MLDPYHRRLISRRADLPRHDAESKSALARLIDTPHLAQVISRLSPDVLHHVIRHHGLDACGAIVAAATPRQITAILDLDLWRSAAPGGTEQFNAARFGAWLEALMEEGAPVAARVIAEMDERLAVAALARYIRVFDPVVFEPTVSSDDERDRNGPQPSDDRECEIGGYVIRARTADTWDAHRRTPGHPQRRAVARFPHADAGLPGPVELDAGGRPLSECPVVPDALFSILDRRGRAVGATALARVTTRAQIDRVHEFGARLRDLLLH